MSEFSFKGRTRKNNIFFEELYVCSAKEILPSEGRKKLSNQLIID